jgi:hypothetical protein
MRLRTRPNHALQRTRRRLIDLVCRSSQKEDTMRPTRPNHATMELTATRHVFTFQMTKSFSLRATRALGSGSSSCSR